MSDSVAVTCGMCHTVIGDQFKPGDGVALFREHLAAVHPSEAKALSATENAIIRVPWPPKTPSEPELTMPTPFKLVEERNELVGRIEGVKALLSDVYHGGVQLLSIDFDPAYETLEDAVRALR